MTAYTGANPETRAPSRERIELILGHLDQLPTLAPVAVRLLTVTTSDDSSARDVIEIIESDASLTASVLHMVRRADLGVRDDGITVARAVPLLGFTVIRNAVLSAQVFEALTPHTQDERVAATRMELWKHSLATACTAEMLAERLGERPRRAEAFVCGLLHDIGKIALDACLPKSYARVVERADRRRECICDVERDLLGLDHTVAGKRLLARWRLPRHLVDCAWLHHQPPDAIPSTVIEPGLVGIVHLADSIVRRQRIGYSGYRPTGDVDDLAARMGLEAAELAELTELLPKRMEPFYTLVGLGEIDGQQLYAMSLARANKELGAVNAELAEANHKLKTRSACFDALSSFNAALTNCHRIEDVCVAVAESLRAMIGGDCALVAARGAAVRCLHVGCSEVGQSSPTASVVDFGDPKDAHAPELIADCPGARGIMPAPETCAPIWRRCTQLAGPGKLWLLPLVDGDRQVGVALFSSAEDRVARFRSAREECEALSSAMGLAVASVAARLEAERMTEELVDLNRRFRAAETELVRGRSVSMIAAMAAGAAHEINNPLSVISGRAQLLLSACKDPDMRQKLETVIEQTHRAAEIVTDLMDFAKPTRPEPVIQPLLQVCDSLSQYWRAGSKLGERQLTTSLDDESATVFADPRQLPEMLNAVIANAVEATDPETGCLLINSPPCASDETVRIVIEDNGVGMPPDVLEHAVDPFFSSRTAGRGRGLGLSRAYRLAEINGGKLWLESTPNVGTAVTIELPARAPRD